MAPSQLYCNNQYCYCSGQVNKWKTNPFITLIRG
jgi:hypothetical protein